MTLNELKTELIQNMGLKKEYVFSWGRV